MNAFHRCRGSALIEFGLVFPVVLLLVLAALQTALAFYAKSNLNYATFEAARAGSVDHAKLSTIYAGLARGLVGYYGGGQTALDLSKRQAKVYADLALGAARIEILSPTSQSFDDYQSPDLSAKAGGGVRVLPGLDMLNRRCPADREDCPSDPASNASGQSLQDASLLALRITYGIPPAKQVPIAGRLYTSALQFFGLARGDAFVEALLAEGRIPIVARTTLRMQSDVYEPGGVATSGGLH